MRNKLHRRYVPILLHRVRYQMYYRTGHVLSLSGLINQTGSEAVTYCWTRGGILSMTSSGIPSYGWSRSWSDGSCGSIGGVER